MGATAELKAVVKMDSTQFEEGMRKTTKETMRGDVALRQMNSVADGNLASLTRLGSALGTLGRALSAGTALVGAWVAGWEAGKKIGDWLWPRIGDFTKITEESGAQLREQRREEEQAEKKRIAAKKAADEKAIALQRELNRAAETMAEEQIAQMELGAKKGYDQEVALANALHEKKMSQIRAEEDLRIQEAKSRGASDRQLLIMQTTRNQMLKTEEYKHEKDLADKAQKEEDRRKRIIGQIQDKRDEETAVRRAAAEFRPNVGGVNADAYARMGGLVGAQVNPGIRAVQADKQIADNTSKMNKEIVEIRIAIQELQSELING